MFKTICDLIMFSAVGLVKVSLLLLFSFLAVFVYFNSKDLINVKNQTLSGFITPNSGAENIGTDKLFQDHMFSNADEPNIENITPEAAEIFLFILRFSDSISPSNALKLANLIVEECDTYEIDPYLILAVIKVESEFSPVALSNKGAIGLMQVMPRTGKFVAQELGIEYQDKNTLYDPFINVRLGIHYLSFLSDRFNSTEDALAAYNYGPAKIAKIRTWSTKPGYVRKVLDFKNYLRKESIILAKTI